MHVSSGVRNKRGFAGRAEKVAALRRCTRWAPVIGASTLRDLDGYDLVVADGLALADHDDSPARERLAAVPDGALAISYLSLGTVESWRSYAATVPEACTLGTVPGWKGERYVDAGHHGWQEIMLDEAIAIAERGFDGLFLDNLDVADEYPRTRAGLVELVERLRAAVPDQLLVAQNGLGTINRLPVDAMAHEDTWWRWEADSYVASDPQETDAIVAGLRLQRARGLTVFTLDYTEPDATAADEVATRSRENGFVPAISVLALDRLPHAPRWHDLPPVQPVGAA